MAKTSLPILRKLSLFIRNKSQFRLSLGQPFLFFLDFYGVGDARFYLYLSPLFLFRLLTGQAFDIPRDWQDRLSIDPGLNNPLSCHWYAVDYDGNVYVTAEHFEAGRSAEWHCRAILNKCAALGWRTDCKGRVEALIDSAANQHTLNADKSVAELFCDNGILVDTRVDKDLFSGINRVKQYLMTDGKPRLFVFDTCVNLIRELKAYRWGDGDRPVKTDDHCLDELRYYLMSKPLPPKKETVKSEITLDKERLIRRIKNR